MVATNTRLMVEPTGAVSVAVKEFHPGIAGAWDRWLQSRPGATPFHSTAWMRALEKSFGYESRSLYVERNDEITGVLPLFLVSNWIVGRCLMSTPFADYGGTCVQDEDSADALIERAKEIAIYEKVDFLELRHRHCQPHPEFLCKDLYVGFACDLERDPEAGLKKLPRDTRYMIRKAEKAGLELRSGVDEQLSSFYELFATSWRRFGTPVFSQKWLETLAHEFRDTIDLKLAYYKGKAVVGVLTLSWGDTLFPHYAGAAGDAGPLAANNFIYWELMKDAARKGMRRFDFGRSKRGTGAFQFKSSWNMQVDTLDYQTFLVRRKVVPNFSPTNPKFELATRLWSRMPLKTTTWLGPRVVRWFP